ncbi:unnamed protein product [Echinostoma caproni]|uniref:Uncharacterized protein n=1 Tax=Echinostoma caproni TaxID=27848 RepID=A0A3P8GTS9_9TREM|nr:unnamed protein product [Echinostoma caproni]
MKVFQPSHEFYMFRYFYRSSVKELMAFTAKLVCKRTNYCQRGLAKEQEYIFHVHVCQDDLYFIAQYPPATWTCMQEESATCKDNDKYLQLYQNPAEADVIMRLNIELDETKVILHNILKTLLSSDEELDDLLSSVIWTPPLGCRKLPAKFTECNYFV